ncbi:hypothetical protein KSP39_PZI018264 [Platanthera zijinensis]|uniref:Protein COFACTOR ASSEMBLY OF COMPLEX C SUBUNIT B CCB4, chloroplastic n=1 Tax=Platanthera zijinensis TaxID=2320716 RepID=A0AAP0FYY1_9ASPA
MKEGRLLRLIPTFSPWPTSSIIRYQFCSFSFTRPVRTFFSSSSSRPPVSSAGFKGPKPRRNPIADWVSRNDTVARTIPIFTGGISLMAVLLNRAFSGIPAVADASSSQSRADILTLALAVTNLLTGLVWLSIQPKYISSVAPYGIECRWIDSTLPECSVLELLWAWESLSAATCCRSFIVVHGGNCLLQVGVAAESSEEHGGALAVDAHMLTQGSLYKAVLESRKQSYLANLSLYPGRTELPFLPSNTQVNSSNFVGDGKAAALTKKTRKGVSSTGTSWVLMGNQKLEATRAQVAGGAVTDAKTNSKTKRKNP